MNAQRCPVCEGRGNVPAGFYNRMPYKTATNPTEECRACSGRGYLLLNEPTAFVPANKPTVTAEPFKVQVHTYIAPEPEGGWPPLVLKGAM